jgi:uncharacterized membrane protein
MSDGAARVARVVDRGVAGFMRHWLLFLNAVMAGYVGFAVLAPLLRAAGHDGWARPVYAAYSLICHQRAERSIHLHGEQMAFCERDTAIFSALFVGGMIFALLRPRIAPLSVWALALLSLPMAIDGLTQLVGLRESTLALRVVTGGLFGVGVVWLVYPHLERGFKSGTSPYKADRR